MTRYRIVNEGDGFTIQRKIWLFWVNCKRAWNGGECVELISFPTLKEAQKWIVDAKWVDAPITEEMIDAVYPYINGSLPLEERKEYAREALDAAFRKAGAI